MPLNGSGGDTPEGPSQSPEGAPRESCLHSPKYQERVSLPGADSTENLQGTATDQRELGQGPGTFPGKGEGVRSGRGVGARVSEQQSPTH